MKRKKADLISHSFFDSSQKLLFNTLPSTHSIKMVIRVQKRSCCAVMASSFTWLHSKVGIVLASLIALAATFIASITALLVFMFVFMAACYAIVLVIKIVAYSVAATVAIFVLCMLYHIADAVGIDRRERIEQRKRDTAACLREQQARDIVARRHEEQLVAQREARAAQREREARAVQREREVARQREREVARQREREVAQRAHAARAAAMAGRREKSRRAAAEAAAAAAAAAASKKRSAARARDAHLAARLAAASVAPTVCFRRGDAVVYKGSDFATIVKVHTDGSADAGEYYYTISIAGSPPREKQTIGRHLCAA